MNKKILIGCIIALVIIVLASFTPVVGFQSTKSSSKKTSPLFTIRSKRATDTKLRDLPHSNYIGKEESLPINIPKRSTIIKNILSKISPKLLEEIKDIIADKNLKKFNFIIEIIKKNSTLTNQLTKYFHYNGKYEDKINNDILRYEQEIDTYVNVADNPNPKLISIYAEGFFWCLLEFIDFIISILELLILGPIILATYIFRCPTVQIDCYP